MIIKSMLFIVVYMFILVFFFILICIILKEGFKDVFFSFGNLKIWKGIGFVLLIFMIICGIIYFIVWFSGFVRF